MVNMIVVTCFILFEMFSMSLSSSRLHLDLNCKKDLEEICQDIPCIILNSIPQFSFQWSTEIINTNFP